MNLLIIAFVVMMGLFLHPYVTYPFSLVLIRWIRGVDAPPKPDSVAGPASLSLLFCAYNEEQALPAKIANLRAIKRLVPEIQILAYCDMSSDASLHLLQQAGDVLTVIAATERTGKAAGMASLVARATVEICVFTDANVTLVPDTILNIPKYFADERVGGIAGSLRYVNEGESSTALASGLYWRLEEAIKASESALGSIMGADGSIFATRRSLYPAVPPYLLDDMIVSMSVLLAGRRLAFAPDVIAHEKNTTLRADEYRRKRRIACRAFNTHRYLWPRILAAFSLLDLYKYASHKLLRWFGFPILGLAVGALALGLGAGAHPASLMALLAILGTGLTLGAMRVQPFDLALDIAAAILGTFHGLIDACAGKKYQIWSPAQSRN